MCDAFDVGAHQAFRIFQIVDVRDRPQIVFVRFVNCGAIEFGRELLLSLISIVDLCFHEVRPMRRQIPQSLCCPRPLRKLQSD
jgi:hypothetical protein